MDTTNNTTTKNQNKTESYAESLLKLTLSHSLFEKEFNNFNSFDTIKTVTFNKDIPELTINSKKYSAVMLGKITEVKDEGNKSDPISDPNHHKTYKVTFSSSLEIEKVGEISKSFTSTILEQLQQVLKEGNKVIDVDDFELDDTNYTIDNYLSILQVLFYGYGYIFIDNVNEEEFFIYMLINTQNEYLLTNIDLFREEMNHFFSKYQEEDSYIRIIRMLETYNLKYEETNVSTTSIFTIYLNSEDSYIKVYLTLNGDKYSFDHVE